MIQRMGFGPPMLFLILILIRNLFLILVNQENRTPDIKISRKKGELLI
jgi:hypothetical protein